MMLVVIQLLLHLFQTFVVVSFFFLALFLLSFFDLLVDGFVVLFVLGVRFWILFGCFGGDGGWLDGLLLDIFVLYFFFVLVDKVVEFLILLVF
jgi:hypothetical protein